MRLDYSTSKALGLASLGLLVSRLYGYAQKADCRDAHARYHAHSSPVRRVPVAIAEAPRPNAVETPVARSVPVFVPSPLRLDCRPWRVQYRAATTPERRIEIIEIIEITPPACRRALGLTTHRPP